MTTSKQPGRTGARWRALCVAVVGISSIAFFGCAHFSGKYETTGPAEGAASVEFKSGSKAYLSIMGTTLETEYTVDGDKVTFKNVNGSNLVMTEEKDGSLTGPMGLTLKKKQ